MGKFCEDDSILGYRAVLSRYRSILSEVRLIMEAVRNSETSVYFNETTLRYIPEGCHVHTFRRENLQGHEKICVLFKEKIYYLNRYIIYMKFCRKSVKETMHT
jgi:hypothetical protein